MNYINNILNCPRCKNSMENEEALIYCIYCLIYYYKDSGNLYEVGNLIHKGSLEECLRAFKLKVFL